MLVGLVELLCKGQGGFRRGMDTAHIIFGLVDYINNGFNTKNSFCLAAFADLAKAIDSLDRTRLLKKLTVRNERQFF